MSLTATTVFQAKFSQLPLIGRDGNVIGEIEVRGPDAHEKVQKAIESK